MGRFVSRSVLPQPTDRRVLGAAGQGVSPICIGHVDDPDVILAAFDAGINFFFLSADMHWPLYEASRRGLELLFARRGDVRERVIVGVASYVTQPIFCHLPFLEVLGAVKGLEHIDLTIMAGSYGGDFF